MKSLLALLVAGLSTLANAQDSRPPTDPIIVCVPRHYGWNMASNPVLRAPGTDSIGQVFCGASQFFRYTGGYQQNPFTAQNGEGLWIKVVPPGLTMCCVTGGEITQDTIPVNTHWNCVGTISHPVPVSSVYSIPPGLIVSGFFGFDGDYVRVDTLRPGFAYWVKTSGAGQIVLSSGL